MDTRKALDCSKDAFKLDSCMCSIIMRQRSKIPSGGHRPSAQTGRIFRAAPADSRKTFAPA